MFNSVEYVRELCKERKIAVSQLERECGFANGYLNPKKISKISYDRALVIAEYLKISVDEIMHGKDKTPTLTKDERKTEDDIVKFALFKGDGEVTDAMLDEVKAFAAFVQQREKQKKESK